jgi:excisionase family DNA binding protein
MLRALVLGLRELVRADGGEVSPAMRRLLFALHEAAEDQDQAEAQDQAEEANARAGGSRQPPAAGSGAGTAPAEHVTVTAAAEMLGSSAGYVRRLARRGVLPARRVGPLWLIEAAALDSYRYRRRTSERADQHSR